MPQGKKAQALHPLPYPDDKTPYPDWQEQIYNAWWNGYILGYPERFIDSYCETFHNGLTVGTSYITYDYIPNHTSCPIIIYTALLSYHRIVLSIVYFYLLVTLSLLLYQP